MPVRIYDISKKLGLENKEVLSKAKELGIAAARVASSSLDKITAEYLEQQLILAHPHLAAPPAPPPAARVPVEPIVLVTAPPPETEAVRKEETPATSTAVLEPESESGLETALPPAMEAEAPAPALDVAGAGPSVSDELEAEPAPVAKAPPAPAAPAGPKVGDQIG